jgi:hypothetical protein
VPAPRACRACIRVACVVLSVGRAGRRRPQAPQKGILSGEESVGDWDLPAPSDAKLLAKDVTVRLRRSWRDTKSLAHFLVRTTSGDEFNHLALALGDAC